LARKILLADDSVTAQNMGRRILTDAGYEVVTVNNGSAALKKIAESKPDLIILDVYMPGYGGLEVCQRLKEAQETARIPVLLSVGKLEPFKVEESRRVRADGFIIKPFEASELLTALTKLEDKIVPQAESFKPGRFAKAIASAEQLSTTSAAVGEESGWKSRLTIPAPTPKTEEPETQASQSASEGLRQTAQREESKSIAMKTAEVAAALPQGITPEELAALAAAANAFAGKTETTEAKVEEVEAPVAASVEAPVEAKTETPVAEVPEAVTFASAPPVQEEERKERQTPAQAAEMARATTDAEVLAALASLSPSHEETPAPAAESASTNTNGDHSSEHHHERASGETGASGPRWIAQSVAIADDESTLVLEREMEKAYAAMAALEAEKASAPEVESNPSVVEAVASAETTPEISPEPATQPAEGVAEAEIQTPTITENIPEVSAPEAAVASETSSAFIENVIAVSEMSVPAPNENAAYAAAASAGAVVSEPSSPATETSITVESNPGRESELAAAWQNWKQIRESIVGSSSATPKAETAAPEIGSPAPAEVVTQAPTDVHEEESASDSGGEASEISSIVDTMLAELKPKLMEEISKKMGKSKKKK
jgi:two-component system chemotaxis response regulator CheY